MRLPLGVEEGERRLRLRLQREEQRVQVAQHHLNAEKLTFFVDYFRQGLVPAAGLHKRTNLAQFDLRNRLTEQVDI